MRLAPWIAAATVAACAAPQGPPPPPGPIEEVRPTPPAAPSPPDVLPSTVVPRAYRLELTIDPAATSYAGVVELDLDLATPQGALWWHAARSVTIDEVTVRRGDAAIAVAAQLPAAGGGDVVGVALAAPLAAGPATVRLAFRAALGDGVGVFRDPAAGRLVATHFEPEHARAGFPCLDEPRWRAPIALTLRTPDGDGAYANTPEVGRVREGDWVVRRFAPTPPLPTYLVAFAVGALVEVAVPGAPVPTRILAPPGTAHVDLVRADLAELMVASSRFVERAWPWPKLDVVVVPSLPVAMENPGLVTIAGAWLEGAGTADGRAHLEQVVAHELAHAWFGAWVTPRTWSELWLNEGLATWMADRVTRRRARGHRADADRIVARRAALAADDAPGARPLRPREVAQPRALFDAVTYHKGAAVMHALEAWLGDATLAAGLTRYLDAAPWSTATTDDLAAALTAVAGDRPVADVVDELTRRAGVPAIAVTRICAPDAASLRVLPLGANRLTPVCLRWGGADGGRACVVVDGATTIAVGARCPPWHLVEPDGYARWRVAPAAWASLATAPLPPSARLASLDAALDALADGAGDLDGTLALAGAALTHGDAPTAAAAATAMRLLVDAAGPRLRPRVEAAVAGLAARAVADLGAARPDDEPGRAVARAHAVALAGTYGRDRKALRAATRTVAAWRRGARVAPLTLGPALAIVGARGTGHARALLRARAALPTAAAPDLVPWLGLALAATPEALAAATATDLPPAVRHAVGAVLAADPTRAAALFASLDPGEAEDLRQLTSAPCAAPPASATGRAPSSPVVAAAVARCQALVAQLAGP